MPFTSADASIECIKGIIHVPDLYSANCNIIFFHASFMVVLCIGCCSVVNCIYLKNSFANLRPNGIKSIQLEIFDDCIQCTIAHAEMLIRVLG